MNIINILVLIATVTVVVQARELLKNPKRNEEARLIKELLYDYDTDARPVKSPSDNITVLLGLNLQRIEDFNEDTNVITFNLWVNIMWKDEFLTWNPVESGVPSLRLKPERIWIPDLLQYDMVGGPSKMINTRTVVSSDGTILWVPPVFLKSQCHQSGSKYDCIMKFGSWTYNGEQIDLRNSGPNIDISSFMQNPRFDIIDTYAKREVKKYDCCPEEYIDITYGITLKKKDQ